MTLDGDAWPTLGEGGVPALWDQIPEGAKWQIIAAIGCLEWYDEWQYDNPAAEMPAMADKPKHYMRGGQPGIYRVEINRCVGCTDNSSPSHFSAMTRPSWLGQAVEEPASPRHE